MKSVIMASMKILRNIIIVFALAAVALVLFVVHLISGRRTIAP